MTTDVIDQPLTNCFVVYDSGKSQTSLLEANNEGNNRKDVLKLLNNLIEHRNF